MLPMAKFTMYTITQIGYMCVYLWQGSRVTQKHHIFLLLNFKSATRKESEKKEKKMGIMVLIMKFIFKLKITAGRSSMSLTTASKMKFSDYMLKINFMKSIIIGHFVISSYIYLFTLFSGCRIEV